MPQPLHILEPGRLTYAAGLALQQELVRRRQTGAGGDTLILLEHEPVITLGRNAHAENVLAAPGELARQGIAVADCDRGGDVTWHGPGQLVGYPILDLRACQRPAFLPPRTGRLELGPVEYVRGLEEVLIGVAARFGVAGRRIPKLTGVWTAAEPARKLAAIGVHIARGVSSHGFALNVSASLAGFDCIIPCGIRDHGVTSLARETGGELTLAQVIPSVKQEFLQVFGHELADEPVSWDDKISPLFHSSEESKAWL